ncbi:hypothetical protein HDV00_002976 [Rhizophlyctis rosea]|nr:hypothetical protein HDV00_002976 [Rhizophlyctis rosea]
MHKLFILSLALLPAVALAADSCSLKPETGPCRALFYKYYYDSAAGQCKQFVWGGCGGVVPFQTETECEKSCESTTISPCAAVLCARGKVCVPSPKQCKKAPCPQYECVDAQTATKTATFTLTPIETKTSACAAATCESGYECQEDPKQCFTTPCPQYTCVPIVSAPVETENPCASALCESGTECKPDPKECFTTPCPQFTCVPFTVTRTTPTRLPTAAPEKTCKDKPCKAGQTCVSDPKQCFTTPYAGRPADAVDA